MLNLIFVILIAVFAVLLTVTVALVLYGSRKRKNYTEATGVIVKFREATSPAASEIGEKRFSPIVSYIVNGQNYKFVGNYCSTGMKAGQKIHLLYNPEEPSKAIIKKGLYVAPMITGALTLMVVLAIAILLVLKSKGIVNF